MAQRGICWGMSMLSKLFVDIAFTIEGRDESELPECALGTAALLKFPMPQSIDEKTMFQQPYPAQLVSFEKEKKKETGPLPGSGYGGSMQKVEENGLANHDSEGATKTYNRTTGNDKGTSLSQATSLGMQNSDKCSVGAEDAKGSS